MSAVIIPLPARRLVTDPLTLEMLAGYRALPIEAKPLFVTLLRAMAEHWPAHRLRQVARRFAEAARHSDPAAATAEFMRHTLRTPPAA